MDTLNLENVLLVIEDIAGSFLSPNGEEIGKPGSPIRRDWRRLRERLPNLFFHEDYDRVEVARWLNDAGYVTEPDNEFTKKLITDQIEDKVFHWANLVSWGWASLEPKFSSRLKKRIDRYRLARGKKHFALPARLLRDLGAAENLDFQKWEQFLTGLLTSGYISARLALHDPARPVLTVTPESAMHAIMLTIFIDRVLTKRRLSECKWCRRKFWGRTESQMFCPPTEHGVSHQSLWKTKFRRDKVKAVKEALKAAGRKWDRAASRATATLRKQYPKEPMDKLRISPQWAKKEMMKGAQ